MQFLSLLKAKKIAFSQKLANIVSQLSSLTGSSLEYKLSSSIVVKLFLSLFQNWHYYLQRFPQIPNFPVLVNYHLSFVFGCSAWHLCTCPGPHMKRQCSTIRAPTYLHTMESLHLYMHTRAIMECNSTLAYISVHKSHIIYAVQLCTYTCIYICIQKSLCSAILHVFR